MPTYTLLDLIVFWHNIAAREFNAIIDVLDIIDNDEIPEEDKRELIMKTLRFNGLYEIGYTGDMYEDIIVEPESEVEVQPMEEGTPIDVFEIKIMNGTVVFGVLLN